MQFLDASRPWAIYVYAGIYIGHWVFLGLLAAVFAGKRALVAALKEPRAKPYKLR